VRENAQADMATAFLKREFGAKRSVQRRFTRGDWASNHGKSPGQHGSRLEALAASASST
jgi:hypothetical protein